ncbi:unnamed protein product [Enterobius vermicularis]|uniref:Autophagy-related protein 9 n=1 Tax=Enterobius vermicularis TaxID=51028 RepID=A0A0N4VA59_ENTVE|nr:unnamed protein product [Enterobius vermicularis]
MQSFIDERPCPPTNFPRKLFFNYRGGGKLAGLKLTRVCISMFGKHRKREGYEMIDVDNGAASSSMADFPLRFDAQSAGEREPLVRIEGETPRQTYTDDAPVEHALGSGEVSLQRQTTSHENRWEHIGNPDQFFTRFYQYHQGGGFMCVAADRIFYLFQYFFVIFFATFLFECVDYDVLFNNKNVSSNGTLVTGKRRFEDIVIGDCASHFHTPIVIALFVAAVFWIFLCVRAGYHLVQFYEIRSFYRKALGIDDGCLSDSTWCEILALLCSKLPQLHVIITKDRLSELDVYQRILRFKNYFVALVNENLLPPVLHVPFVGPHPYLSNGLRLNLDFLFFRGPLSPWEKPYTLKEEYKNSQNIGRLTEEMRKSILILGCVNLLFMPLIFAYQVLYIFFSYVELVKRDPSAFGKRRYSNYGRSKLRHYNELDHELQIRLSRSHNDATQYMDLFTSPFVEILAKNLKFVAGSIFAVIFALAAWDEDVLSLEHCLTLMTATFLTVIVCNSLISSEDQIYVPEQLMKRVIANISYAPTTWEGKAHTKTVWKEFDYLFPLTAQFILEELISPLLTPFILLLWLRPRAEEFVKFFNHFTVSIEGLGDVCSFAQMDIFKHGDRIWMKSVEPLIGCCLRHMWVIDLETGISI